MKENLFEYIKYNNSSRSELLDLVKFNISEKVYYYGEHFNKEKAKPKIFFYIKYFLILIYTRIINFRQRNYNVKNSGLSSTYHNFDSELEKKGFRTLRLPNAPKKGKITFGNLSFFLRTIEIQKDFIYEDYNYLISENFLIKVENYFIQIIDLIKNNNLKFLLITNDNDFFSRVYLKAFKKLKIPTFIIAHGGMPTMFDKIMDNGSDYITMWGNKQIESFVKAGYEKSKFFNSGHPFYNKVPKNLRFGLKNVLILTKSINGVCPLDKPHLEDRGNIIMYLYSIENTLKKVGVENVLLRPHPSENPDWYLKFINKKFFKIDYKNLKESLTKSSLVIGPASTTFIDALAYGVNYLIYEPIINDKLITGFPIRPPLDDSDNRIPVARDENQLYEMLIKKNKVDISVYKDFANPKFDLSFFDKIIR